MKIEFVAGFAPITSNPRASAALYLEDLGLPLTGEGGHVKNPCSAPPTQCGLRRALGMGSGWMA